MSSEVATLNVTICIGDDTFRKRIHAASARQDDVKKACAALVGTGYYDTNTDVFYPAHTIKCVVIDTLE